MLAAGRNFINNSGSTALSAANGRWLVYSADPAANTRGGLMPDATDFNKTYAGNAPATIGAGNRFVYSRTSAPTIVLDADNASVIYGDAFTASNLALSYVSGLVGGDSWGNIGLTGSAGLSTSYVQGGTNASASAYSNMITGTLGTLASKLGYAFSFTSGDLTVTKRTITTALTGTVSRVYNGLRDALLGSSNYTLSNVYGSDNVTIATTSGEYDDKNVGTGKTITVNGLTLSGTAANNYQLASTSASGTIGTITPRDLSVAGVTVTGKTYDGLNGATLNNSGATLDSGFIAGDAVVLSTVSSSGVYTDVNAGTAVGVTASGYSISGADSGNYTFTQPVGLTGAINKKTLTVTADSKTVTYGTAVPTGSFTYNGFVLSEDASVLDNAPVLSSARSGIQHAGTYANNYTLSGGADNNYTFNYVGGALIVDRKALVITVGNQIVTYGTAVPTSTLSYNGFISGENAGNLTTQASIHSAQTGIANAGTYTGNYTASGAASSDYTISYVAGDLTVNKKDLNIIADNKTITYGDTIPGGTVSYDGFIAGEDSSVLDAAPMLNSALSGIQHAGIYANNYTLSGGSDNNYTFNLINGNLLVNRKVLNVTAGNRTVTYGDVIAGSGITFNGFVNGDTASVLDILPTLTSQQQGLVNVGTYAGNYQLSGGADNNYSFAFTSGNLIVTPRVLNVTTLNRSKDEDQSDPAFVGSNNLLAYDAALIQWLYEPIGYNGAAGTYTIGATATDPNNRLSNYTRVNNYGHFTVNPVTGNPLPPTPVTTVPDVVLRGFAVTSLQSGNGSAGVEANSVGVTNHQGYTDWKKDDAILWRMAPELKSLLQVNL